jgi:hypothetical protein
VDGVSPDLPNVDLDPLARLRVLARVLDGVALHEAVLDVPYGRLWPWVADIERSIPAFDRTVRRVTVLHRRGDRLRLRAWPSPVPFDVEVRDGFMWMHSPVYVVGMAAAPDGPGRTRVVHVEGFPVVGPVWLQRLQRPLVRAAARTRGGHVAADVAGIARALRD